jgi:hypothetical protein
MVEEQVSKLLGRDSLARSDEDSLLGQHTHKGDDGVVGLAVMAERTRKIGDEVHRDMGPGSGGDGVGLKKTRGSLGGSLGALTSGTGRYIGLDIPSHARPPEMRGDGVEGLDITRVTSCGGVMELVKEALS